MAELKLVDLTKTYDNGITAVRDVTIAVPDGQFVVLVGPSGCGKTTTLRMIAGLEPVTRGEIRLAGQIVNRLPASQREIAMVFQHAALYSHMTVAQNIEFGLRMRRVPREERRRRVLETAQRLQVTDVLDRWPCELSGGQQQRVALGRALVRQPRVFLMDEPLAHLDATLRTAIRDEIVQLWTDQPRTTVYVTHDQMEAMTMSRHLVVMRDGQVQQAATSREVYDAPQNAFVASFIGSPGMNLWRGQLRAGRFTFDRSTVCVDIPTNGKDMDCLLGVRPEELQVSNEHAAMLRIAVRRVELLGHAQLVYGHIDGQPVVVRTSARQAIGIGEQLPLTFRPEAVHMFSATAPHPRIG